MLIQFSTFILIALISRIWSVRAKFLYIYIYIYMYIYIHINVSSCNFTWSDCHNFLRRNRINIEFCTFSFIVLLTHYSGEVWSYKTFENRFFLIIFFFKKTEQGFCSCKENSKIFENLPTKQLTICAKQFLSEF